VGIWECFGTRVYLLLLCIVVSVYWVGYWPR